MNDMILFLLHSSFGMSRVGRYLHHRRRRFLPFCLCFSIILIRYSIESGSLFDDDTHHDYFDPCFTT